MTKPLVSVIMPAHNAAPYLRGAMQSILDQTMADFELLVVDDASTDETGAVARRFADPRVRYFRSEAPLNAAGARNMALAEATGEFVTFLDADDWAEPARIAIQVEALRHQPDLVLAASPLHLVDEADRPLGRGFRTWPSDEIPGTLLFENCLALSSVTVRRAVLEPFQPEYAPAEDYELWIRLRAKGRFAIGKKPLVRYRVHASGVSSRQPERMRTAVEAVHAQQLAALGFRDAPRIHRLLSAWPLQPSPGLLSEAEAWLLALSAANDRRRLFAPEPFRRVLAARWFAICLDSWQLGWPVWNLYHHSPLAAPTLRRRAWLLRRLLPQRWRAFQSRRA